MKNSLSVYQELLGRLNRSKTRQRQRSDQNRSAPTRETLRKEQEALREERRKGIKSNFVDTMPQINFPLPGAVRGIGFAQGQPGGNSISGPRSIPMDSLTGETLIQARKEHQAKLAARNTKLHGLMKDF